MGFKFKNCFSLLMKNPEGIIVCILWHFDNLKDDYYLSSVSTLFVGRAESYTKSNWTSSQGAVGLSYEALTSFYQDFRPETMNNQRIIDRYPG